MLTHLAQLAHWRGLHLGLVGLLLLACAGKHTTSTAENRVVPECPGAVALPDGATPCRTTCAAPMTVCSPPLGSPVPRIYCPPGQSCVTDSDCGDAGDAICDQSACGQRNECQPSCTVGGCSTGYQCAANGR